MGVKTNVYKTPSPTCTEGTLNVSEKNTVRLPKNRASSETEEIKLELELALD
jgi:hypothetical protein